MRPRVNAAVRSMGAMRKEGAHKPSRWWHAPRKLPDPTGRWHTSRKLPDPTGRWHASRKLPDKVWPRCGCSLHAMCRV